MSAKTMVLVIFLMSFGTWTYADECNGLRYSDNGDGTVQDCRTGLIWLKDTNCADSLSLPGIDKTYGVLYWYDALTWVAALGSGHCGLTDGSSAGDWRLPTKTEWMAMVASARKLGFTPALTNAAGTGQWTSGDIFNNVILDTYWSSMSNEPTTAWTVYMFNGTVSSGVKAASRRVWPVRGGQSGEFGSVTIR